MGIFGGRKKATPQAAASRSWWPIIREPFTGAWQQNKEEPIETLLTYPTLYACIRRIVEDVGKLPFRVRVESKDGVLSPAPEDAATKLLRAPNHYQTPQQFREMWELSRLMQGNSYVLLQRDADNFPSAMYILNPWRVMPMVADSGAVYYKLYTDDLNHINAPELVVSASDIIHDRCMCPYHPLIGLPPLAAANLPTLKNLRILQDSIHFFSNGANPSGILTAPGAISDPTAARLEKYFNENFQGANAGRIVVTGDGLEFKPLTAKSVDSQMVEQLRYSDEQICQVMGVPPFKIGIGSLPAGMTIDALNQLYYNDALQAPVQAMEWLLTKALVTGNKQVDVDESYLMRMDLGKKAKYHRDLTDGKIEAPNEARSEFNLPPLEGGDTIYMQQQDFPLDQVRLNRIPLPAPPPEPEPEPEATPKAFADAMRAVLDESA